MNFSNKIMVLPLLLSLYLALPFTLDAADVKCEELDEDQCAFAVSAASKRCILDKTANDEYQCKTSDVVVEKISNYLETAACLGACGLERRTIGISSDALLDTEFIKNLCSPGCSMHCPNIVDLYTNLASGEGGALVDMCEKQKASSKRDLFELLSSGAAAGPDSAEAPSPSA